MMARERGFTLIEMLIVVVIISILAGILLPKAVSFRSRARAASAVGSMSVVRNAAYNYNEGAGKWPANTSRGVVPTGLAVYLPSGFKFKQQDFDLLWKLQTVVTGGKTTTNQMVLVYPVTASLCTQIGSQLRGSKNPDLVIACTGSSPTITLYVDK